MPANFEALLLDPTWIRSLRERNITEPTAIQQEAIPVMLEGKDIVARSQTGTGKTLAYVLPLLQKIVPSEKRLQALILVPTRELGAQIAEVLSQLTEGTGIGTISLIGGAAIGRQVERLKLHPQIAVGTPGRILELIKLKKLSMHYVRSIVLDEADQVFELGGVQDVETVIRSALRDRQLCFFSATIPDPVKAMADRWMSNPEYIQVQPEQKAASTLEHLYVVCEERERIDTLRRLVRSLRPRSGIVFTNEVDYFGEILAKLQHAGLSIEGLYSDAGKQERAKVMKDFREGRTTLLLATDVAARGLDIPEVTHVFHFDLPLDADHYVHRSGRTGRMGRSGTAVSLCTPKQLFIIEKFRKTLGIPFVRKALYEGMLFDPEAVPKRNGRRQEREADGRVSAQSKRKGISSESPRSSGIAGVSSDRPASPAKNGTAPGSHREQSKAKAEREKERKNKGAPRWLKAKRDGNPSE